MPDKDYIIQLAKKCDQKIVSWGKLKNEEYFLEVEARGKMLLPNILFVFNKDGNIISIN